MIKCTCDPSGKLSRVDVGELKRFQGDFKTLHKDQYAKLKQSIESKGFFAPIFVWAGHEFILDGHQRLSVLEREGWEVEGGIPIVEIEAEDEKDAAEKLLLLSSTYGKVDAQGTYEFVEQFGIDLVDWGLSDLPDFDVEAFGAEFVEGEFPRLPDNDDEPEFTQMTFVLHVSQADIVRMAIERAKDAGVESAVNKNSDANALAVVCGAYNEIG